MEYLSTRNESQVEYRLVLDLVIPLDRSEQIENLVLVKSLQQYLKNIVCNTRVHFINSLILCISICDVSPTELPRSSSE